MQVAWAGEVTYGQVWGRLRFGGDHLVRYVNI